MEWCNYCIFEYDYVIWDVCCVVGVDQSDVCLVMVFDGCWKYMYVEIMWFMLFDFEEDLDELNDFGDSLEYQDQVECFRVFYFVWVCKYYIWIIWVLEIIEKMIDVREFEGIYIVYWDQDELEENGFKMLLYILS